MVFLGGLLLNIAAGQIAYYNRVRFPELHLLSDPLRDALQRAGLFIRSTLWPDIMVYASFGLMLLIPLGAYRGRIVQTYEDYFFQLGVCLMFRAIIVPLTNIPDPSPACVGDDPEASSAFFQQCGSMMYSGHTTFLMQFAINWTHAYDYDPAVVVLSIVYVFAGILGVMMCQLHYTMDVAVALLVNGLFAIIYYWAIRPWLSTEREPEHDYKKVKPLTDYKHQLQAIS